MPKQPFTPAGVQTKNVELYALSNTALAAEATKMNDNFRTWLADNFTFTTDQQTYLDNIDEKFITYAGFSASQAAGSRLPITLTVIPKTPWSSKYIITRNLMEARYEPIAGYTVTGSVAFEEGYI